MVDESVARHIEAQERIMDKQELEKRRRSYIKNGKIVIDLPGCWLILPMPGMQTRGGYIIDQDGITIYMESGPYTGGDPFLDR